MKETTKILWSGITGRTGSHALRYQKEVGNVEIVTGICRSNDNYYNYEQLNEITEEFDVIVDFSHTDSFDKILNFAIQKNKPLIIGTAKLTEEQSLAIESAANIIPIFRQIFNKSFNISYSSIIKIIFSFYNYFNYVSLICYIF